MRKPAIIVISSHVMRGTVGTRAAAFALEVMGFPVWTVPTVTLPWHPGHTARAGAGVRSVPPSDHFANALQQLASSPWRGEVGGVLSGYLGDAAQVDAIAELVSTLRQEKPDLVYALDPVMGDGARLYVPEAQAVAIRQQLLPLADIITPNPFELSWLAGKDMPATNEGLAALALQLGVPETLVTSAHGLMTGQIGNLLVQAGKAHLAEHRRFEGPPNGLGDLASALWLGHRLSAAAPLDCLKAVAGSLHDCMALAAREGSDELVLERSLGALLRPRGDVTTRSLMLPR